MMSSKILWAFVAGYAAGLVISALVDLLTGDAGRRLYVVRVVQDAPPPHDG